MTRDRLPTRTSWRHHARGVLLCLPPLLAVVTGACDDPEDARPPHGGVPIDDVPRLGVGKDALRRDEEWPPDPDPGGGGSACINVYATPVAGPYQASDLAAACSAGIAAMQGEPCLGGQQPLCIGHQIIAHVAGELSPYPSGSTVKAYVGRNAADCSPAPNSCPAGMTCGSDGNCTAPLCSDDSGCPSGKVCVGDRCEACDPARPATCAQGFCDPSTYTCAGCTNDMQCGPQRICDFESGNCVAEECSTSNPCEDDDETCRDGRCLATCQGPEDCGSTEDCIQGVCTVVRPENGQCTPPRILRGTTCWLPCQARPDACNPPLSVCNPQTGNCDSGCGDCPSQTECRTQPNGTVACIDVCDGHQCPLGEECYPINTGITWFAGCRPVMQCNPDDLCCGQICTPPSTCNLFTGGCEDNSPSCAERCSAVGQCAGWLEGGGPGCYCTGAACNWNQTCGFDGQCSSGSGCVLDGVCQYDESCSCDAACCTGGGSGSGGGESCGWCGGNSISYSQCFACGGSISNGGGGMTCMDAAAVECNAQ